MTDPSAPAPNPRGLANLDKLTRFASEGLARQLDRRSFLKRAGGGAFLFVAALASGQVGRARASAPREGGPVEPRPAAVPWNGPVGIPPRCSPPGPYCNISGVSQPDGCQGGNCFEHKVSGTVYSCTLYYTYYAAGCWTTADPTYGGYWTCCDCRCDNGSTCGCAQWSQEPLRATA
jgi:hypothetical protein